jgi:hypothetical protein
MYVYGVHSSVYYLYSHVVILQVGENGRDADGVPLYVSGGSH